MLFQPAFGGWVIRTQSLYLAPKPARVVHVPQVGQFVQDNVVPDARGHLDQAPVERDGATARTRTPARLLIPHRDAPHDERVLGCEFPEATRQFIRRQPPKVPLHLRAQIRARFVHRHQLIGEPHLSRLHPLDPSPFSAKENLRPDPPLNPPSRALAQPLPLPLQPVSIPLHKSPRFDCSAAAWNRDASRAVRPQPQDIAAGPGIPFHLQRQHPRSNLESVRHRRWLASRFMVR